MLLINLWLKYKLYHLPHIFCLLFKAKEAIWLISSPSKLGTQESGLIWAGLVEVWSSFSFWPLLKSLLPPAYKLQLHHLSNPVTKRHESLLWDCNLTLNSSLAGAREWRYIMQFSPLEACGVISTVIAALPSQCRWARDQGQPGSVFLAQLCMAGACVGSQTVSPKSAPSSLPLVHALAGKKPV